MYICSSDERVERQHFVGRSYSHEELEVTQYPGENLLLLANELSVQIAT